MGNNLSNYSFNQNDNRMDNHQKEDIYNLNNSSDDDEMVNSENSKLFFQIWRNKYLKQIILKCNRVINNNLLYDNKSYIFKDYRSSTVIDFTEMDKSDGFKIVDYISNLSSILEKIEFEGIWIIIQMNSKSKYQFKNIKHIKFSNYHQGNKKTNGRIVFPDYISLFPKLVHIEFSHNLNYCGPLLEKMKYLETLIFGDDFENEEIIYLPPNLKFLKTGDRYNSNINLLIISHIKSIQFGDNFDQPIFDLNDDKLIPNMSLTSIVFGSSYNRPFSSKVIGKSLNNLNHLEFGRLFNVYNLPELPTKLKSLVISNRLPIKAINSNPNSLQSIKFSNRHIDNDISSLKFANNLKSIEFGQCYTKSLWLDNVCQLPRSITRIDLSSVKIEKNFGFDVFNLKNDLPNIKTIIFNQSPTTLFKNCIELPDSLDDIRCIISNLQIFRLFLCSRLPIGSITFNRIKVDINEEKQELKSLLQLSPINLVNPEKNLKFVSFNSCEPLIQFIPISNVESLFLTCNLNSIDFIFDQLKQQNSKCKNLYLSLKSTKFKANSHQDLQLPESIVNLYLLNFDNISNVIYENNHISNEVNLISKLFKSISIHPNLYRIYCFDTNTGFINYSIDNNFYHLLKLTNKNQILNTLDFKSVHCNYN